MSDGTPNKIERFFHCSKCLDSIPAGESPRSWAQLEVGITFTGGIQVWCKRHEENIICLGEEQPVLQ